MATTEGPGNDVPGDLVGATGDAKGHRNLVWAWVVGLVFFGFAVWGVAHLALGLNSPSGSNLSRTQTGPTPGSTEAGRDSAAGGTTTVGTTGGGAPSAGSGAPTATAGSGAPTATAGDATSGGASGGSASAGGSGRP